MGSGRVRVGVGSGRVRVGVGRGVGGSTTISCSSISITACKSSISTAKYNKY